MEKFLDKLIAISAKFAQNSVLNVIQGAFMMLMPVTMIGGFTALFNGLGIDAYQAFIASTGIKSVLSTIYQWTIGMFGVYVAFLVAYQFAKTHRCAKSDIAVGHTDRYAGRTVRAEHAADFLARIKRPVHRNHYRLCGWIYLPLLPEEQHRHQAS